MISLASSIPKGYRDISTHGSTNPKYTRVKPSKSINGSVNISRAHLSKKFFMSRTISQPNASIYKGAGTSILSQTASIQTRPLKDVTQRIKLIMEENDDLLT